MDFAELVLNDSEEKPTRNITLRRFKNCDQINYKIDSSTVP